MKAQLNKIGVIVLGIGIFAAIMLPHLLWIGGLLWGVGALLIALGAQPIGTKLSLIIGSIVLYGAYQVVFFISNKTEPETFLIPAGYEGKVRVFYSQLRGEPEAREDKRIIYQIPDDGIYKTQVKFTQGFVNYEFWMLSPDGSRLPIPYEGMKGVTLQDNEVAVRKLSSGVFKSQPSVYFYVGRKAGLDQWNAQKEARFDSLAIAKLK